MTNTFHQCGIIKVVSHLILSTVTDRYNLNVIPGFRVSYTVLTGSRYKVPFLYLLDAGDIVLHFTMQLFIISESSTVHHFLYVDLNKIKVYSQQHNPK